MSGNTESGFGGRGGYAAGKINLEKGTTLYVYVGCVGGYSGGGVAKGGYNGGGYACSSRIGDPAHGGGGASDVRLIGGAWDYSNGLLSRFIVAGGGGGGGEESGDLGGYGGGLLGGLNIYKDIGSGGVFGKGAHTPNDGGGGGGGWIGGNTTSGSQTIPTTCSTADTSGGSGGSGYVYTNTSEVYNGYLVPTKYQMFDAVLTPNVTEGHGSVIITFQSPIVDNDLKCKCTHYNRASFITTFILISLNGIFILK
jgi:hypothetical protein